MLNSSTHHPIFCQRSCSFLCLSFQPECHVLHSSSLILSSFAYRLNRSAVWNLSYPLCHSFNSSGGSVLLISSSIIQSCQLHVQFLPLQSECCPNYIILMPSLSCFNRSVVSSAQVLFVLSSLASCFNQSACIYFMSIATHQSLHWSYLGIDFT